MLSYRTDVGMDSSLTDHDLARLIIPKLGVLLTSVCQVKAFEGVEAMMVRGEGGQGATNELRYYAILLWRWLWLLVLCGLCAGGIAYGVSNSMAPVYAAATTLQINSARIGGASDYTALLTSNMVAKTYAELLRKRPVLDGVIADLALPITPDDLGDRITISVVRDTQLLQLTVEDLDPQRAADLANKIVSVFSEQNQAQQASRYQDAKQSLEQEMAQLQLNIDTTQASLDRLKADTAGTLAEQSRLQEQLAQYRTTYATLFKSLSDVRLAEVQTTDTVAVVESARAEPIPIRPRTTTNTLLAVVVGILLAAGLAFLMEYLNDTVGSSEDISTLLNLPTLAQIGRIDTHKGSTRLVMAGDGELSPSAEAYIGLRVNLEFTSVGQPDRTILVTSASPSEGKSITAANLAVAIAQSGKRVILVDTDLRRPSTHKIFAVPNVRGVTTALFRVGGSNLVDHMLLRKDIANLYLMPSGPLPPNPADLLGSQRMATLIEDLKSHADVVIFDSSPLLAVVDAALLARACDATLLVALAGKTRSHGLKHAADQLAQSGGRIAGVVINRVHVKYGGYGNYAYGSNYRYAAQPKKRGLSQRLRTAGPSQDESQLAPIVALAEPPADHRQNGKAESA